MAYGTWDWRCGYWRYRQDEPPSTNCMRRSMRDSVPTFLTPCFASAYALSGRAAEAKAALANARAQNPAMTSVKWYAAHNPRRSPEVAEGLRMAGLPEDEPPKHLSIVVLPFTNLSGDPKQDYFADGITDNLTTDLSRIRNSVRDRAQYRVHLQGQEPSTPRRSARSSASAMSSKARCSATATASASTPSSSTPRVGSHLWADRFEEDSLTCSNCRTMSSRAWPTPSATSW